MALRYLAANRVVIPYLVSDKFLFLFRWGKESFKSAFEVLKSRIG